MLPNFLGIGAPKAATTWIFHCLRDHSDIFVPGSKEVNYFGRRYSSMSQTEYERYFDGVVDEASVGEITTLYLYHKEAPYRAYGAVPDAKLFVSLRNPIDQVYSHFWHLFRQGLRNPRPGSFEEALEMYPEKILTPACYYEHISRWLDVYDRSQLHIILYRDISDRPEQTIQNLFSFLGVDSSVHPSSLEKTGKSSRRGTSPRSKTWEQAYTKVYDFLTTQVYMPLMNILGHNRAEKIKNKLRVREVMEIIFRSTGYPNMNPETRVALRDYFSEDIRKLESLVGIDLQHWK
jgi:hypothetical protein